MNKILLDVLSCPICKSDSLELAKVHENDIEIMKGTLTWGALPVC